MSTTHNVEVTRDAPRAPLAPIDTSVRLPPSVLAAAERAEAAHKAAYAQPQPDAPAAGETPAAPVEGAAPAAQPTEAPGAAPPAAPVAAPPVAGDPPAEEGSWEHKFKSQQGRVSSMNRSLQQMQQQMGEMGSELMAAQETIAQLRSGQPRPGETGSPRTPTPSLITDKDRTDYGEDFLDVAARAAQQAILPEVAAAREEAAATRQELHEIKVARVKDVLTTQVPYWRNINRHPNFHAWLSLRDGPSGVMRKSLLDGAMKAADAARVVSIFQGFLAEDAASRPAEPAPQPAPAPGQPAPAPRAAVSLDTLTAPGRASSAPGTQPAAVKPIYTRADYTKFSQDVIRGKYAGREPEKLAIEADMHAAQFDGRIRG